MEEIIMDNKKVHLWLKINKNNYFIFIFFLVCFSIILSSRYVYAFSWDPDPPILNDDPRWEKVRSLWNDHYEGKNIDELIDALIPLKDAYPAKIEPIMLLARAHYFHARYVGKERKEHFEKSEQYALKACKMDPKNLYAIAILLETLCYSRDRDYIFNTYGNLIKSYAPIESAEALPDMKYPEWNDFKSLWLARIDIEKSKAAIAMVEKIANENPKDGLAQIWASRANYYVGEYYTCINEHDKGMPFYEKGIAYAKLARKLLPYSVPANYWYQLNRSRAVQFTSILNKALYLMDILVPLYFCSRENSIYYFVGPALTLATMITNGGWVVEKGMRLVNITLEMDMNALEIAEIIFPNYYYIPFARADLLAYKGKKAEALAILEKLIIRDPYVDPLVPENYGFIQLSKRLYNDIKQGKY